MGEPRSRETLEIQVIRKQPEEAKNEDPRPPDEFKGYSLELLAILEG